SHCRWQAGKRGNSRPDQLVHVRNRISVNLNTPFFLLWRVIVRESRGRHDRTDDDIIFTKQLMPLPAHPCTRLQRYEPVPVAQDHPTGAPGGETTVAGWDGSNHGRHAMIEFRWYSLADESGH